MSTTRERGALEPCGVVQSPAANSGGEQASQSMGSLDTWVVISYSVGSQALHSQEWNRYQST